MNKSLPQAVYAATQHSMRGRFTSLLVLIGLLFGIVVMPVMAHASGHTPVHDSEMLDVHEVDAEIEHTDHSQPTTDDTDTPCHTVNHHHCSIALQLDAPRVSVNGFAKALLVAPSASARLLSRSQAPPLDPPNA